MSAHCSKVYTNHHIPNSKIWNCTFWQFQIAGWIYYSPHCRKCPLFLVILVILLTAEPVRILKMEVPQVSNFEFFTAEPLNFHYCWTFEILDLLVCLLLNLWTFFIAEPLRLSVAAEPMDFLYCWTFEIMPWIMYLFTAEPLDFIYCWTFEIICLLLNLWIFYTAQTLDFFYCWTFEIMPWIMYLFDAEALRKFSSKQNHQKSGPLIKRHESEITDISIIPAKI